MNEIRSKEEILQRVRTHKKATVAKTLANWLGLKNKTRARYEDALREATLEAQLDVRDTLITLLAALGESK